MSAANACNIMTVSPLQTPSSTEPTSLSVARPLGLALVAEQARVATTSTQSLPASQDAVLQALPAAVILIDQRGFVFQANPVALSLLGEPLVGQRWLDIISRCFRPRSDDGMEVSLKDGRRVKLAISPLQSDSQQLQAGQLIMLTDLTETRKLQSRLSHMQRLSSLGKMMASLAHQIRTPLSAAMLYAQNLADPRITLQTQQQFQTKLQSRLQDLEQQVNDMLLFARSGTSQAVKPFLLTELLDDVKTSVDALLVQHDVRLDIRLPEQPLQILGNVSAISGALQNLIHNSVQAVSRSAHIMLSASLTTNQPQMLQIQVADNGPGVPEHITSQLFEPFVTSKSSGTGLGLAVVQAVAHSHQGTICYHAAEHGGACFTLTLPLHSDASESWGDGV